MLLCNKKDIWLVTVTIQQSVFLDTFERTCIPEVFTTRPFNKAKKCNSDSLYPCTSKSLLATAVIQLGVTYELLSISKTS